MIHFKFMHLNENEMSTGVKLPFSDTVSTSFDFTLYSLRPTLEESNLI